MNVYDILNLLGCIALFLFGMHTLSASLEKLAGGKLETWLEKATSKPIKGVVLGAIITAVIQSSAATTVMIIGFVNSGMMKLSQAIGVIMGANIGTTATSWLLSLQSISGSDGFSFLNILKPTTFTPVLAVIGVILGLGMGWSKTIEAIFSPLFRIIRPIPPIAWIPISIIWLGLGEDAKIFLIFLASFSNVTLNAWSGAKSVDPALIGAAEMLGANRVQIFFTIVLPASVPPIFAGLQVALSSSWGTVLAAEMVRSSEGLGGMIVSGMNNNDMVQILVGIVTIGIVGFFLAVIMRKVENVLCRWNKSGT